MCGIYTDKNIILTVHNFQCDCARLFQPERYPHILWRKNIEWKIRSLQLLKHISVALVIIQWGSGKSLGVCVWSGIYCVISQISRAVFPAPPISFYMYISPALSGDCLCCIAQQYYHCSKLRPVTGQCPTKMTISPGQNLGLAVILTGHVRVSNQLTRKNYLLYFWKI